MSRLSRAETAVGALEPFTSSCWIPVFPLPRVVLLPHAVIPLHVFEQRYRAMTREALVGSRLIALALLKPGYESSYHTLDVEIEPVVCVGRICREEQLSDGRYNFLLLGLQRARVLEENTELRYRRALLQAIIPRDVEPCIESALRSDLLRLLNEPPLLRFAKAASWLDLFTSSDVPLSGILDVLAWSVVTKPEDRQRFLAEASIIGRARDLRRVLRAVSAELQKNPRAPHNRRLWPRQLLAN